MPDSGGSELSRTRNTRYTEHLGGQELEIALEESLTESGDYIGMSPYFMGTLLKVVRQEVGKPEDRERIFTQMVYLAKTSVSENVKMFGEMLTASDEPESEQLAGAFSGFEKKEIKLIVAGIAGSIKDDDIRGRIADSFAEKEDEISDNIPGMGYEAQKLIRKTPEQVEAVANCIRKKKDGTKLGLYR